MIDEERVKEMRFELDLAGTELIDAACAYVDGRAADESEWGRLNTVDIARAVDAYYDRLVVAREQYSLARARVIILEDDDVASEPPF